MGEIADAMLNGLFCEGCGEILDGEETGYPRRCTGCGGDPVPGSGKRRRQKAREQRKSLAKMLNRKAAAEDEWVREHFRQCDTIGCHLQARFGETIINFWPGTMKYAVGPDKGHPIELDELKALVNRIKRQYINQQVKEASRGAGQV